MRWWRSSTSATLAWPDAPVLGSMDWASATASQAVARSPRPKATDPRSSALAKVV